jgi:hypothetical protein
MSTPEQYESVTEASTGLVHLRRSDHSYLGGESIETVTRTQPGVVPKITCDKCREAFEAEGD